MNYILHLNSAFHRFCEDERLSPYHISLYFTLFQYWNLAKFRNPISISRDEIMRACHVGSVNTYIRCMKELHEWKYFEYIPSYNPLKGSQVYMFNFDNANHKTKTNGTDISPDNSTKKASAKAAKKTLETRVRPSKNNSNSKNKTNNSNQNKHGHIRSKNPKSNSSTDNSQARARKKVAQKKVEAKGRNPERQPRESSQRCARPLLSELKKYFTLKKWPAIEAEKFFNYYQSNGWLVGGKTPMRSWKASAKNWIANSQKFGKSPSPLERDGRVRPHIKNDKNYAEPL